MKYWDIKGVSSLQIWLLNSQNLSEKMMKHWQIEIINDIKKTKAWLQRNYKKIDEIDTRQTGDNVLKQIV